MENLNRAIVFLIDGLHWQAPEKLHMPVLNKLIGQGTYINKSWMIVPHHPTVGDYGKLHTSSFPNPVLQEGNLFINPKNRMLQEMFGEKPTAFITNTLAYQSVSRGFNTIIQNPDITDDAVLSKSLEVIESRNPIYLRIHLQTPGNEGRYLSYTTTNKPYYRNIWGEGSPYVRAIENADVLLGRLVDHLQLIGEWEKTLLIVSSDQGQSVQGWHPMIEEDSSITPLLFVGPGIAKGRTLPYFEHTDLSPTIAWLMGVEAAFGSGGSGKIIQEVSENLSAENFSHPQYIRQINSQINEYNTLRAHIILAGNVDPYYSSLISYLENELLTPEPFYHQDRFTEWYKAGDTAHLIEANGKILKLMCEELKKFEALNKDGHI